MRPDRFDCARPSQPPHQRAKRVITQLRLSSGDDRCVPKVPKVPSVPKVLDRGRKRAYKRP